MGVVLVLTVGFAVCLLVSDKKESEEAVTEIRRNDYGRGDATYILQAVIDGKEQDAPLEIEVGEKQYTEAEMKEVFKDAVKKLESLILGRNRSLDDVREDLHLIT